MLIDILTALPGIVSPVLEQSILRRAVDSGIVRIRVHDLRAYAHDPHRQVDDYPFGGGAGMVLKPEPIFECIEALQTEAKTENRVVDEVIFLTPDGDVFDQATANTLSLSDHLVMIAGHYKGIDQRVRDELVTREISVGDYVLSGGELPALVLVDAVVRLVPGVLGDAESALTDSFQDDLLAAPTYTRPAVFRGMEVPAVLRSGDHNAISDWREAESLKKTARRRPDLLHRSQGGMDAGNAQQKQD